MDLKKLCFTVCIVCIVFGAVLSLAMIWGEVKDSELAWRCWLTIGVFFSASALTLFVNNAIGNRTD